MEKETNGKNLLTLEEQLELVTAIQDGDENARERFVTGNRRFVEAVAKHYLDKGLSLDELIVAGNKGLIHAAEHYNPDCGIRFISYLVAWIRQSIIKLNPTSK